VDRLKIKELMKVKGLNHSLMNYDPQVCRPLQFVDVKYSLLVDKKVQNCIFREPSSLQWLV